MSILGRFGDGFREIPGNFGSYVGLILTSFFDDFSYFFIASVFASICYGFGRGFGWIVASFSKVALNIFPDPAKNAAPHGSPVNTDQIEGRARGRATKKAS